MRVIGLTGGIGAGKSEVSAVLSGLGAAIIDADREGHLAYRNGSIGWRRIVELFSVEMLGEDGEIDRQKLGRLVFGSPQAMAWLNAAIHPLIRQQVSQQLTDQREAGTEVVVVDAALLYQAKWDDLTDEVWAVVAPVEYVIERLKAQRGLEGWEIRRRIDAQEPVDMERRADVVITNTGTVEELHAEVRRLWYQRILGEDNGAHGREDN